MSPLKCARTACYNMNAMCRHKDTGHLYCPKCARKINEIAPGLVEFPKKDKNKDEDKV